MSQDRTEKPTPQRLKEVREKGQIPRSRDLALAAASVASTIALARLGPRLIDGMEDIVRTSLTTLGDAPLETVTAAQLSDLVTHYSLQLALLVGPLAIVTTVVAVGMHGFQGGWSFAPGALQLHWSRLNPATGVKKMALSQSGVETIKAVIVFAAVGYFTWGAVQALALQAGQLPWMPPTQAAVVAWSHAEQLLWRTAWLLGALALGDYAWQHFNMMRSLKMTRQEVRDEHKRNEGSGEVKGRMRRLQRELSRGRMLSDVSRATVVITNPTEYAVALEYRRESMSAPRVLAKGRGLLAARIKAIAREHGIPTVENVPLARALYKSVEVGEVIPSALFAAVAAVLADLIRLRRLVL